MKPLLLLISITFFFPLIAQENTNQITDSIISWNANRSLSWNDFKGNTDPNTFGTAMTIYSIEIIPENVLVDENDNIQGYKNLTCDARFHKYLSWTTTSNFSVLKHERLHFDIAEVYAKRLRVRFEELKSKNVAKFSSYMDAYNEVWQDCRKAQMQYDKLTKHGRNLEANLTWENSINEELAKD